ncbi:MAG TPA: glycosyl hydrolase family 79 C-terminal domain-containing protein [Solirubrobacteraceae bacterium]|nr:glycosyl hydrolase family 79 C-terminal domain-containing protein [Solirubrobacteraceae bacterium]
MVSIAVVTIALCLTSHESTFQSWLVSHKLDLPSSVHRHEDIPMQATGHVTLTAEPAQSRQYFAPGAVGLSMETQALATWPQDLSTTHKSLVKFMQLLGPAVLRIGGSSLDYSWWTANGEQPPSWATSIVTPSNLVTLRELLERTNWHVVLGVDFGHFDPTRAAGEARIARQILGSRLLGIEIGNEPDAYGTSTVHLRSRTYDVSDYLNELAEYAAAIKGTSPTTPLYGPDFSLPNWLSSITPNQVTPFAAITDHYYAAPFAYSQGKCQNTTTPPTSVLLSPQVREQENVVLADLIDAGELAHRETRISETNATPACRGSTGYATNPVFASALWSLDWSLRAASAGVSGLNFHGSFGQCTQGSFSPVCTPAPIAADRGLAIARPEYYGLYSARQLEGGYFVPVHLSGAGSSNDLTAYATVNKRRRLTLAIDNFSTTTPATLSIDVEGYRRATYERLTAPSIESTDDVSFGHASFDAFGELRSKQSKIVRSHGGFKVDVEQASAMIIRLRK